MDSKQHSHDFLPTLITLQENDDTVYSFHHESENVTSFRQKYFFLLKHKNLLWRNKVKKGSIVSNDDNDSSSMNTLEHNYRTPPLLKGSSILIIFVFHHQLCVLKAHHFFACSLDHANVFQTPGTHQP